MWRPAATAVALMLMFVGALSAEQLRAPRPGMNQPAGANSSCGYSIDPAGPDGVALLRGHCDHPREGLARLIQNSPGVLDRARELALGRTPLTDDGVFDRCALLAQLAADPHWTRRIDSLKAQAPLGAALTADGPSAPVRAAIEAQGKHVVRVSVEVVRTKSGTTGCSKSPETIPFEALVWLSFE